MTDVLQISNAHKRFGEVRALAGISLSLREGECLGLIGPNGAGKTTTLRAICGRIRLDEGAIRWPAHAGRAGTRLGLVPQEIALYPLLTGIENLEIFGGLHGLRGAALGERVAWALDWMELAQRARDPVNRWSVGMKRRLNVACGLLHAPRLILLDEPTVGVDPESRQRIWSLLDTLRKDGAALLLTTHQLHEAQSVSDRIAVIDRGKLIASGTPQEIVRDVLGTAHRILARLSDGSEISVTTHDVAAELLRVLAQVQRDGKKIEDLEVTPPHLEAAFLKLTRGAQQP